jgi:hypothetical protein
MSGSEIFSAKQDRAKWFIDHADRVWRAHCEVAERYAARGRTLLTLATTMLGGSVVALGTGLGKISSLGLPLGWRVAVLVLSLAVVGVTLFYLVSAMAGILDSRRLSQKAEVLGRRDRVPPAAELPGEPPPKPGPVVAAQELFYSHATLEQIQRELDPLAFLTASKLLVAARDLERRNIRQRYRIQAAEQDLGKASVGVGLTLLVFLAILGLQILV